MQIPPANVLASWPTPNYVNPVTRGPTNTIMNLIFFPILLFVVGLRIYTRVRVSRSFGLDDALILAAMVCKSSADLGWSYLTSPAAYHRLHGCKFVGPTGIPGESPYLGHGAKVSYYRTED